MKYQHTFFFLLFSFHCVVSNAQGTVPVQKTDSILLKHSPVKATLLSTFIPGAGQVYNRKYWKVPVVYAGLGLMAYTIDFNNDRYKKYRNALKKRLDDDPSTTDDYAELYSDEDLVTLKDFYHRNRDLSVIGAVVVYVLNIIDASVDAHLFYFDVSDNLEVNLQPSVFPSNNFSTSAGISLQLKF